MTTIHFSKNPDIVSRALLVVERHEEFREFPYMHQGHGTYIGFGTNLTNRGISRNEASTLVLRDICEAIDEFAQMPFWANLAPARQVALLDMAYHVSLPVMRHYKVLFGLLERNEWAQAGAEIIRNNFASKCPGRAADLNFMITTGRFMDVDEHD